MNTTGIVFGAVERSFTYDFDGGLPDGSDVAGSAEHSADEGVDGSGALVLTRNVASQRGGWLSENIGTVDKFKITFDIYIADGTDVLTPLALLLRSLFVFPVCLQSIDYHLTLHHARQGCCVCI